nr:hypothetical protein [uncultured archaeon]
MKKLKRLYIPQCDNDLNVRVLLFEKYKPKLYGLNFCCWINDVPVYTDSTSGKLGVFSGSQGDLSGDRIRKSITFLIVGFEPEEILTDSTIMQTVSKLIVDV